MATGGRRAALLVLGAVLAACGDDAVTTCCVLPPDRTVVTAGFHTGNTEITFLSAEPPPGATLVGCGSQASACDGRVRMRFWLRNPTGGPVLDAIAFLHGGNQLACWQGRTGPFRLERGTATEILVSFDTHDPRGCPVPFEIRDMKLVVEGTVEVSSRQEWTIRYDVRP